MIPGVFTTPLSSKQVQFLHLQPNKVLLLIHSKEKAGPEIKDKEKQWDPELEGKY